MIRQPPVYSPLRLSSIAGGVVASMASGDTVRARFARDLETALGAHTAILTSSGTHALQIALSMVRAPAGERVTVALPGYSCFDLVTAAVGAGVDVRFYDIDPVSLSPDMASVRQVVEGGVSALVAANLYGFPLDWPALQQVCGEAGVPIIEDAAQGVCTRTAIGEGGALGEVSVLSFGRGKGWTGGGGGALLLRTPPSGAGLESQATALVPNGVGLRSAAVTLVAWALGRPALYRIPTSVPGLGLGETRYHEPGTPRAISKFSASLASRTACDARRAAAVRRVVAASWREALGGAGPDASGVTACEPLGGDDAATYLRFPIVADSAQRAEVLARSGHDLGMQSGYPVPLHRLPQSASVRTGNQPDLPGSVELASSLLTLPTHRWINAGTLSRSVQLISRS